MLFARTEGLVPHAESSHAIAGVVKEAVKCREAGQKKCCCSICPATACSISVHAKVICTANFRMFNPKSQS